jgi:hypothetical protein
MARIQKGTNILKVDAKIENICHRNIAKLSRYK